MKLTKICLFLFALSFSIGCDKSDDLENGLLNFRQSGSSGIGKNTLITMANGSNKKVSELCIGDLVLSNTGSSRKLSNIMTGYSETIWEITTVSGSVIVMNIGQPINTSEGWSSPGQITPGITLLTGNGNIEKVETISVVDYRDKIYILMFDEATTFIANSFIIADYNLTMQLRDEDND